MSLPIYDADPTPAEWQTGDRPLFEISDELVALVDLGLEYDRQVAAAERRLRLAKRRRSAVRSAYSAALPAECSNAWRGYSVPALIRWRAAVLREALRDVEVEPT